jgi:hypothetical protein
MSDEIDEEWHSIKEKLPPAGTTVLLKHTILNSARWNGKYFEFGQSSKLHPYDIIDKPNEMLWKMDEYWQNKEFHEVLLQFLIEILSSIKMVK